MVRLLLLMQDALLGVQRVNLLFACGNALSIANAPILSSKLPQCVIERGSPPLDPASPLKGGTIGPAEVDKHTLVASCAAVGEAPYNTNRGWRHVSAPLVAHVVARVKACRCGCVARVFVRLCARPGHRRDRRSCARRSQHVMCPWVAVEACAACETVRNRCGVS